MKQNRIFAIGGFAILALGFHVALNDADVAPPTVAVVSPASVVLRPAPIRKDWVLSGTPVTEAREIARSPDNSTSVFVWQTSAGRFNWTHESDEIVTIVDGEVFVTDTGGPSERRLGPGDVAFFPQGAVTTWRVPDHVRKIATLKRALPRPVAGALHLAQIVKSWLKPTPAFAAD